MMCIDCEVRAQLLLVLVLVLPLLAALLGLAFGAMAARRWR